MVVKEAIDVLIKHGICLRHMATCNKECSKCTVAVQDKKLIEAYDIALDALAICTHTELYQRKIKKGA